MSLTGVGLRRPAHCCCWYREGSSSGAVQLGEHPFDAGAAWQNFALQGSVSGLVVHGMEGFDYARARELLNVPDHYEIEMMIAVGKPGDARQLTSELLAMEKPSDDQLLPRSQWKAVFGMKSPRKLSLLRLLQGRPARNICDARNKISQPRSCCNRSRNNCARALLLAPIVVGGLVEERGMTAQTAGYVIAAELTGMALGIIPAAGWLDRLDWRVTARLSLAMLCVGNLATGVTQNFPSIIVERLLTGLAAGTVSAICAASLAHRPNPGRWYGILVTTQVLFGGLGMWALPHLISHTAYARHFSSSPRPLCCCFS